MRLREKDIRKIYQSSADKKIQSGHSCPSVDALLASFSPETSEEEKLQMADHVAGCGPCRRKFEAAREILKGAAALASEAEGVALTEEEAIGLRQRAAARLNELEERQEAGNLKDPIGRKKTFLFRYRHALMAAGLVMIIAAALIVLRAPQEKDTDAIRGERGPAIVLITPRGLQNTLPLHFQWQPCPAAETYMVKILDERLDVVWDSGPIRVTSLDFPPGPAEGLKQESIYYWKVMVLLNDGTTQESDLQEFRIKGHTPP
jgi:hypothetical protein